MRQELTLKSDYVPNWGLSEGFREFVSNGYDAQTEMSAPCAVAYNAKTKAITIRNDGTELPREAVLIGHSTKANRSDTRGHFGEGLDLAMLSCVRAGYPVTIRTGAESWTPTIARSEKFNANVLVLEIRKGLVYQKAVTVRIEGVSPDQWDALRWLFLELRAPRAESTVITPHGTLILDPEFKGRIYVKGVFVNFDERYDAGYDLKDVETDRDRKMVRWWELEYRTRMIWGDALPMRPDLFGTFLGTIEKGKNDFNVYNEGDVAGLNVETVEQAVAWFTEKHGDKAFPVATTAESRDVENVGKIGVVVPKALHMVLARSTGTVQSLMKDIASKPKTVYAWSALSERERRVLQEAIALVADVVPAFSLAMVDVVDFHSDEIVGQFTQDDQRVLCAKRMLADFDQTLITLVHEVSHFAGGDGSRAHIEAHDAIWVRIVNRLREKNWNPIAEG